MTAPEDSCGAAEPAKRVELDTEFELWSDEPIPGVRFVHHKLIADAIPVPPGHEQRANDLAARARAELQRLEAEGDFEGAVRLHHHDHWVEALLAYEARLDDETYWRLAGEFYCDYAAPSAWFASEWKLVFANPRSGREAMMNDAEQQAYARLPDVIDVLRGHARKLGERGFSWTLSESVAARFAQEASAYEGATEPRVAHGTVRREDAICVLLRRGEAEIVARPGSVSITKVRPLAQPHTA